MKSLFLLSVTDALNSTIRSRRQAEKLSSLSVIGEIPHASGLRELLVTDSGRIPFAEAYRVIRENFQNFFYMEGRQVIGIHSVTRDEGKTFTAVNLARTLASGGEKVLLIGANMRQSRLHQFMGLKNDAGLSTYLTGACSGEAIIQKTIINNLEVVTSGPVPVNPEELLGNEMFRRLITRGRSMFNYVIIDNAPVSVFTDGLITSRLSDLNIFILRCGVSRKSELKLINKMDARGIMDHLALVINDVRR